MTDLRRQPLPGIGDDAVCATIAARLRDLDIDARWLEHPPIDSAEHAAALRSLPLSAGGKAVLVKAGSDMRIVGLSASRRLDSRALRRALGVSKLRFATVDELLDITGLVPGSLPPLGRPVLPVDLVLDGSLARQPVIAFTPGRRDRSVILAADDFLRLATATEGALQIADFTRPITPVAPR
ncbi:MAG: hypothetical protein D6798_09260 [Deltaproteobacteria bacterium]|nr:MAG: hypothetical protein D6798_09260 [Deltaproteobacteria bacterium]